MTLIDQTQRQMLDIVEQMILRGITEFRHDLELPSGTIVQFHVRKLKRGKK